ncbi:MAG: GspB domain-containing protein [Pseudomonadales bacterium]|nr:GspB domain-containing protein [Pseudomonadales bacterium]NIX08969.1 GspB domain-containing protein [Pseudomonadales bacterium]
MSYILDALKKSEAENDPATAASLALTQQRESARNRTIAALVVVALLANAAVLLWIFRPDPGAWQEPTRQSPAAGEPTIDPVAASVPEARPARPAEASRPEAGISSEVAAAEVATVDVADAVDAPPESAPQATSPPPARIRTQLADLPDDPKSRFPGLAFSTHVYAEDAVLRAVVANGTRLQEGDRLNDVTVEEITEDGVILAFENYLVEIPVIESWQ